MRKLALAAALLPFAAACTPQPPLPGVPTGECSTNGLGGLVGRYATGSLVGSAKRRSGASVVRVLKPGQIVTMEYRNGRLNVNVDSQNRVRSFTCG